MDQDPARKGLASGIHRGQGGPLGFIFVSVLEALCLSLKAVGTKVFPHRERLWHIDVS